MKIHAKFYEILPLTLESLLFSARHTLLRRRFLIQNWFSFSFSFPFTHIYTHTADAHSYDARGALNDLAQYEPPPGGYTNRLDYLSAAEQRAEQLCEEERYYSLYNNEVEEELYFGESALNPRSCSLNDSFIFSEESMKRQTATHGQIAFNYDNVDNNSPTTESSTVKIDEGNDAETEEDLEPFVAPRNFDIPIDMEVVSV
jgi:Alternative splicing regulator